MGRINKGLIASISGDTARVVPSDEGTKPTAKITIPSYLRGADGRLKKGTEVVYVEFDDFTGLLLIPADGGNYTAISGGLPAVTDEDNGKILRVVDGVWEIVDPPQNDDVKIDGLPEVTDEDNGKILLVVDGAWKVVDASNNEGSASVVDIFAKQSIPFINEDGMGIYMMAGTYLSEQYPDQFPDPKLFSLVAGKTYFVEWDGEIFGCVAKEIGGAGVGVGNFSIMNSGEDTGEPFLFGVAADGSETVLATLQTDDSHTVYIYQTMQALAERIVASIDLSAFDSEGKIVETYTDGTTATTTVESDAFGLPIKITDANGVETTITW